MGLVRCGVYGCLCLLVIAASSLGGHASEALQYHGRELFMIGKWSLVNNCGDFYLGYLSTSLTITFRSLFLYYQGRRMTVARLTQPVLVWGAYFTLGELGWVPILPGTADIFDIPAALVGCLCPALLSYTPFSEKPMVMPHLLLVPYFIGSVIGNYLYYRLV